MNHPDHICRFNDAPQTCECYDAGYKEAEQELLNKILKIINVPEDEIVNVMEKAIRNNIIAELVSFQDKEIIN